MKQCLFKQFLKKTFLFLSFCFPSVTSVMSVSVTCLPAGRQSREQGGFDPRTPCSMKRVRDACLPVGKFGGNSGNEKGKCFRRNKG